MVEKEIGFVGDITSIQPRLLNTLVESGYLPVVASVAADTTGQALNVNADIAAGEVNLIACHPKTICWHECLVAAKLCRRQYLSIALNMYVYMEGDCNTWYGV